MTYHSLFSGWFSLFGTRGRITHILVLIFAWLVFSITFIFTLYGGLGFSILLMDLNLLQKAIINLGALWVSLLVFILLLTFWTSICVTTQRLRHIGFNGIVLFILAFIAIFPLPIQFYLNIDQVTFDVVYGIYAIFIFIWPGKKIKKDAPNKLNISTERQEPKI